MIKSKYISRVALYFLALLIALTLSFEVWRAVLLVLLRQRAEGIPVGTLAESFLVGLRFDFAIACYLTTMPFILAAIPWLDPSRSRFARYFNLTLMAILAGIAFFVQTADIEFFKFFNVRMNGTALLWNDTPGFVFSSLWETYPVVRYILLFGGLLTLFIWSARTFQRRLLVELAPAPRWVNLSYLPLLAAILLLGMRGRLEQKSPLRWGNAYFSDNDFANQLALNPNFTFFKDALFEPGKRKEVERLMHRIALPDAEATTRGLLGFTPPDVNDTSRIMRPVRFAHQNESPPNVIIFIMESFGSSHIKGLRNGFIYDLAPCFDSACERGILFTNFYSNGMHTYAGIFSTLYGYPHLFGKLVVNEVAGHDFFRGLPHYLKDNGYQNLFFVPHDPHFDNMYGFLKANGFDRIVGQEAFERQDVLSAMGVADHVLFEKVRDELKSLKGQRYMATVMSGSNHGPWIIPESPIEHILEKDPIHKQLDAFKYADWALGKFLNEIATDPDFANTLVLVTGDNGMPRHAKLDLDLSQFDIPLLVYNTDWRWSHGVRDDRLGSQIDIPATVMGLVGLDYDDYTFGHDLLDSTPGHPDFVLLSEWDKIGFIRDSYYHISRIGGPEGLYLGRDNTADRSHANTDLSRHLEHDALSIYQTAYYNMSRPTPDQAKILTHSPTR